MYSLRVSLVLACMVITGASRSVAVKLFYDLGYMYERAEYPCLPPDNDWKFGFHLMMDVPRACHGRPNYVSRESRDAVIKPIRI